MIFVFLRKVAGFVVLGAALWIAGCLMGGGSETEAGYTDDVLEGYATDGWGEPLVGAQVKLFPNGFDPTRPGEWSVRIAVTDKSGRFVFRRNTLKGPFADSADLDSLYTLVVRASDGTAWGYYDSMKVNQEPLNMPAFAPRHVQFNFVPADSVYGMRFPAVAYIPGTDIRLNLDSAGVASMDSVPHRADLLVLEFVSKKFEVVLPTGRTYPPMADTVKIAGFKDGPAIQKQ